VGLLRRQLRAGTPRASVLLCFEDVHVGEFCHRTVFAEWWSSSASSRARQSWSPQQDRLRAPLRFNSCIATGHEASLLSRCDVRQLRLRSSGRL
jgi:hypothetical protein